MLYKYFCREEYWAEFTLHRLRMLENSLIDLNLTQFLLKLLISSLHLCNSLTEVFVDLNQLFVVLFPNHAPLIYGIQHSLMHRFVFLYLLLHKLDLFLKELSLLNPCALLFLKVLNHRSVNCAFPRDFVILPLIVFLHQFQLLPFLLFFNFKLNVDLLEFTFRILEALD
jgi:hypothetical protein